MAVGPVGTVKHCRVLSGTCQAPVGLTLLTAVKPVGGKVGCDHACVLSGTVGQGFCSTSRTGRSWVLRGGDGTGLEVIEQEVIEQAVEVIEHC